MGIHFRSKWITAILLLLLALVSTGRAVSPGMRVLFIGNSLTYWNDLPAMLQAMAKAGKQSELHVETVAFPDHSLEDHWNRGDALRAIRKSKWDFVILQQGPSASVEGRTSLIRFASIFADQIRAAGSKPALFSVWPTRIRPGDLQGSIQSYTLAASEANALLIPVGRAWQAARELDPNLELYAPDGLHPATEGSYLAALVFYKSIFSQTTSGLPPKLKLASGTKIEIENSRAKLLQQAAELSIQSLRSRDSFFIESQTLALGRFLTIDSFDWR